MDPKRRTNPTGLPFTSSLALSIVIIGAGGALAGRMLRDSDAPRGPFVVVVASATVSLLVCAVGQFLRERSIRNRSQTLLGDINDVVLLVQDSTIVDVVGPIDAVLGIPSASAPGLTLGEVLLTPELDRVHAGFTHALGRHDELSVISALPICDDATMQVPSRYVDLLIRDRMSDRTTRAFVLTVREVTDRAHAELELAEAASEDIETRSPNRARFIELVDTEIHRARRSGDHITVLSVGIDRHSTMLEGFQENDVVAIMQEMAARIKATIRVEDSMGRIASDQFGVLLGGLTPAIGRAYAVDVADRISEALRAPMFVAGSRLEIAASIGAAHRSQGGVEMPAADLLRDAEESLRGVRANTNRWRDSSEPSAQH